MSGPDTIYALSSGALPSGVAVIRLSGPAVPDLLTSLTGSLVTPRRATYSAILSSDDRVLDRGIVLYFPAPHSFTGEHSAELQVHGGRATVAAILDDLAAREGLRIAEAGEFTRRAFLNGRMDLTEVEAFSDLIAAETEAQRRFALANSAGAQRQLYESWRSRVIRARAMVEAELDFTDEEDVPGALGETVWNDVRVLAGEIESHIGSYRQAEIIRTGYDVVILGAPNAGKSSLINALARRDVAIVSDEAGTTRDLIEVALDLGGVKVRVTDTAGLRAKAGKVELIGIERARARAASADLVLLLSDCGDWSAWDGKYENVVRVATKADIAGVDASGVQQAISTLTGQGLDQLLVLLAQRAKSAVGQSADVLPSRERHLRLLRSCRNELAAGIARHHAGLEIGAESLRLASDDLGRLSGRIDVEDLLDVIFREFCIGK